MGRINKNSQPFYNVGISVKKDMRERMWRLNEKGFTNIEILLFGIESLEKESDAGSAQRTV